MVVSKDLSFLAEGGNKLDDFHTFEKRLLVELDGGCEEYRSLAGGVVEGPGIPEITDTRVFYVTHEPPKPLHSVWPRNEPQRSQRKIGGSSVILLPPLRQPQLYLCSPPPNLEPPPSKLLLFNFMMNEAPIGKFQRSW